MQVLLLFYFNSHLLFLAPVLSAQWQKPQEVLPCEGKSLGTASPALIFPLINEFRWRETGAHTDPCGSPYQPLLLCARKGFGPTSYKFLARLVLQSKNECPYSDKQWCWMGHSATVASYRHLINALQLGCVYHHKMMPTGKRSQLGDVFFWQLLL